MAAGVILALPDNRGGVLLLRDFSQRPARPKSEDLKPFRDAVKWYNNNPESLKGLARELRLNSVPFTVAMLLPKDREQKMADEEARFARENGRDPQQIRETWFDFILRDGQFEPKAIRQQ
jgi:hypothetical protein